MIPIQQHGKRWLILTLTLSTSVLALASIGASQPVVFADENSHLQSQKNTNKIEVLDWKTFSKKLSEYSSDQRQFHVLKLGFENRLGTLSTWDELKKFGENHDFLVINGKVTQNIHDFPHILVMNKGDVIAHNEEEYASLTKDLRFAGDYKSTVSDIGYHPQRVHALFQIQLDSYKRRLLEAAGLGTADNSVRNVNGFNIYSHGLSIDNKYYANYGNFNKYDNLNVTRERFDKNDQTIQKLIRDSGAFSKQLDREKIKTFAVYVANRVTYDWTAANKAVTNQADVNYYLGSDLFAITEQQKAMCVGFSTTAARAFNMMGIPAYVVTGNNRSGVPHATTRAYYDGKWHTIDATGFINGTGRNSAIYSSHHFDTIGEDSYEVVDKGKLEELPLNSKNYMVIDKEYEEWAKKQKAADLLLVNSDKAFVAKEYVAYIEPTYVSQENKKHLLDIYKVLREKIEEAKAKDLNSEHKNGYESILKTAVSDIEKLNNSVNITEKEFAEIKNSMKNNKGFLSQLDKDAAASFEDRNDYKTYLAIMDGKKLQEDPAIIKDNHNVSENKLSPLKEEKQANSDEVAQNSKDASAPSVNSAQQSEELEGTSSTQETISVAPSQQTPAPKALQAKTELEDKTETSSSSFEKESNEVSANTVLSPEITKNTGSLASVESRVEEAVDGTTPSEKVSAESEEVEKTIVSEVSSDASLANENKNSDAQEDTPRLEKSAEVVTTSQEVAEAPVSAPQVTSSEIQTLSETAPTEEVTETPEPSVVESNSASPTSPETNSAEAVTTSQEMAESSVSVPQVSSEIPTSSETAPAEVATEVSEESSSASQPSSETNSTEAVTTSQEMAGTSVSAPQVISEIPTSPETASTEVVVAKQEVADSPVSAPQVISEIPTSSETAPAEVATEVTEPSVAESNSASPTSPEANSTEAVTTSQEKAESRVSAPQVSFVSPTLEVPKNERLDEKSDATMPNGVGANTHEAGSVPTSDIYVQDAGSDTVPQPYSLSATLFEEAISTVEPVGVATSSQERSAVAGKVKVPASLERSNNSVEVEKVVDSNATIEKRATEKKEVLTSENVLNSLVTIWVALSTSFFMRYFSRGK
ncbi:transglutaminase domain-containing protein [Streptococcus suis]|uniref:Ribonucleases G and E n=1 Tax=Streptococcus suis TaxID=1307 RepID=A0A0Z8MBT7_STRSU|nr:transglutaminase domain-containing protein [Streptococcus suis]NQG65913.1 transglutaminase [Streptococcus suis]NQG67898.1 transglutaminase [Streptococcus suis]CYV97746.1 ribonucleases G and E [Streptococcus suis]CYW06199.1 ribonucleases G and E [Streptococcus suis]